nr:hypothetical protein [uncultured Sphingomonas sp.]
MLRRLAAPAELAHRRPLVRREGGDGGIARGTGPARARPPATAALDGTGGFLLGGC